MVKFFISRTGIKANFGNKTIRINTYPLMSRYGGQMELTTCKKQVGDAEIEQIDKSPKIVLDFSTIESLDIVIEKLTYLRTQMEDAYEKDQETNRA